MDGLSALGRKAAAVAIDHLTRRGAWMGCTEAVGEFSGNVRRWILEVIHGDVPCAILWELLVEEVAEEVSSYAVVAVHLELEFGSTCLRQRRQNDEAG